MALTPQQAKELKDQIKETEDLALKFAGDMKTIEALVKGTALNFGKIADLAGKLDAASKKEKKFREDIRDITKEVLENAENIGTEEFKSLDVAQRLAKARRMGDKDLVKQLTHLKDINQLQKQQNKQITAAAALMKKPFEALDSAIREIPVIGELLADVANFGGLGDNIAQGMVEGFTSGLVETNFSKMMATTFNSAGRLIDRQTGRFVKQGFFIMWITRMREGFSSLTNSFKGLTLSGKSFTGVIVLGAAVLAKMAVSMISFANSTGLAYKDMFRMGGALLVNADAVRSFAEELGTVNNLTTMQALALKIQEKRYGLTAESAAKLFAVQRGITGSSMDQFLALTKSTAQLARMAGVAPKAVFEDMAQNAEFIAKFSDATGENMQRTAIEAQKLGINLGTVDKIAESLLDFETSIGNEMEAAMLLGRNINMDKARELFYTGKTDLALQEVVKQLGVVGNLSELDLVQRKAISTLLGTDVAELSKIIGAQEGVNEASEKQKGSILGAMAAGAALGAVLLGTAMALKAIISGGLSLITDTAKVGTAAALGAKVGAGLGIAGGGIYHSMKPTELATGGVIVGEKGPEVVAPLPVEGVNVNTKKMEGLLGQLLEQNKFLMNRLTSRVDGLALSN